MGWASVSSPGGGFVGECWRSYATVGIAVAMVHGAMVVIAAAVHRVVVGRLFVSCMVLWWAWLTTVGVGCIAGCGARGYGSCSWMRCVCLRWV